MNASHWKKDLADNQPSRYKKELACLQVLIPVRLREPPGRPLLWKNGFPILRIAAVDQDLILLLLPARQLAP